MESARMAMKSKNVSCMIDFCWIITEIQRSTWYYLWPSKLDVPPSSCARFCLLWVFSLLKFLRPWSRTKNSPLSYVHLDQASSNSSMLETSETSTNSGFPKNSITSFPAFAFIHTIPTLIIILNSEK